GRDYRLAIAGAKISANLVRRANRDDHVMRTFEIPACGGFMLAERSDAHEQMFCEGKEAAFFASPDEFVAKVRLYLSCDNARKTIAAAGHRRITQGSHAYADRLEEILRAVQSVRGSLRSGTIEASPREIESNG
ncbi:MAG TPA: glycosyltransferase, partial [Candidatus Binatus sp.]|nr:glycosyltransferase [Candidatus Binatus sp.]